jgi:hypothetical protein
MSALVSILNPNNNIIQTANSCVDPCSGPYPPCRVAQMSSLSNSLSSLQIEYNILFANLDKGQAAQLLAAISQNIPDGQLKNQLLNAGFLSDEVLLAFVNRKNTAPGIFKDVMIPNSPVSDNVRPALLSKIASMPPGISQQIKDAQANLSNRTLAVINGEILSAHTQYNLALASAVSFYVQADSASKAIDLLEAQHTTEVDQLLAATYLLQELLTNAQNKLNSIVPSSPDVQAFVDLHNMLLDLARNNLTVFDIDSAQQALVRSIAAMPPSLAYSNAWAILKQVYNEDSPLPAASSKIGQETSPAEQMQGNETSLLGDNFPNPFSKNTIIPYFLPENSGGYIKVYDINGKLMSSYLLSEGNNIVEVKTENWASGVYYYSMEINGIRVQNNKMALINKE